MAGKNAIEILLKLKDQATSKLGKALGGLKKRFAGLGTAIKVGALAAMAAFTAVMYKAVQAAGVQEVIIAKLQKAVENAGQSWAEAKPKLTAFAAEMQKLTKYGDTQTYQLIQRLLPFTNDYKKAMEGSKIAMDLAASGMFDLNSATRYVGMTYGGNVEMLGRYISELKATTNPQLKLMSTTEKTAYALDLLKQKFGGMAEKELKTFSGRMEQAKNYVGDLKEGIGDGLIPILTQLATNFSAAGEDVAATGERWGRSIGTAVGHIINSFNNIAYSFQTLGLCFSKGVVHAKRLFNMFYREVILNFARKTTALLTKLPWGWGKAFEGMADKAQMAFDKSKEKTKEFENQIKILNDTIKRTGDDLSKRHISTVAGIKENTEATKKLTKAEQDAADAAAKRLKDAAKAQEKAAKEKAEKDKQLEAEKKFADAKAELLEQLQDKIYELTHSETEVRKRELEKQIGDWIAIYGSDGEMRKIIKQYYKKMLAEIKKGEDEAKKAAEGDKGDKKKKEYTKDQLIEMQTHTLTDPGRAEWARKEMKRRRRESILKKKDSPERRRKLAEIDAPTMSEELMEALHAQGGGAEGEKQIPKEPSPKEREAIRKGADSQETKNETISKLSGYIETNSTTLGDILKICADAVDKLKEQQGDIDTLKTQVASLTEGRG